MIKNKCPKCNSTRIVKNKDFILCKKCNYLWKRNIDTQTTKLILNGGKKTAEL